MMLGGRAAEQIFFKEMTAGAASDIQRATRVARKMVTDFGMSDLGPVALGPTWDIAEWGRGSMESDQVSDATKTKVDDEVSRILDQALNQATSTLRRNKTKVEKLVTALLRQETIETDDFEKVMGVAKSTKE